MYRPFILLSCISVTCLNGTLAAEPIEFNQHIRPLLSDNCFQCHGPDEHKRKAKLRFDISDSALKKRDGHAAIVPGNPSQSLVMERLRSDDPDEKMPPPETGKQLTPEQIQRIENWIKDGAAYQAHWSFVPPQRPDVPKVKMDAWPVNNIDSFILARLEAEGLKPSPNADRSTLIRRLSFDLIGLPPTSAEVDSFVKDSSADAYESAVDRLLKSPHFGERMAIYWLDLVRYADTVGYHGDQDHAISPYRDYVINAFNDNMPFDRFTREQIAGDLLPDATVQQRVATGYNRVLQTSHEGGVQQKEYLAKYSADRVRNVSGVWLGATVGCAECHDHKYDPYTQKDFYSLAAFFADVDDNRTFRGTNSLPTRRDPELKILPDSARLKLEELASQKQQLQEKLKPSVSEDPLQATDTKSVENEIRRIDLEIKNLNAGQRRTMITVSIKPRPIRILKRGDWMDDSGDIVSPSIPEFLKSGSAKQLSSRLELADWLTCRENPLTARVFMNRLWYLFFGVGLSKTLDDLGSQGDWPTHPKLLDYLADDFMSGSWDIKKMVKLLVMSKTYRQSSLSSKQLNEIDPENRLFARQSRYRLPAEMIRDGVLAVSGLLNRDMGGIPARPYQPAGYYKPLNFPRRTYKSDTDSSQYRRGVYVHWQRQFLHPMMRAFDAPSREECTAQRPVSNTPLAALTTLNDPTFVEAARVFAERILSVKAESETQRVRWAWKEATSRIPTEAEIAILKELLHENLSVYEIDTKAADHLLGVGLAPINERSGKVQLAAWTAVARALFNLNETITRN